MNSFFNKSVLLATGLALCACDADSEDLDYIDDDGHESVENVENRDGGGIKFNTNKQGAKLFSAINGLFKEYNHTELTSVRLSFGEIEADCVHVWAEEGELFCRDDKGVIHNGWQFLDSIWKMQLDGDSVQLTIAEMNHNGSEYLYRFNDLASGPDKMPTCDEDPDQPGTFWSVVLDNVDFDKDGKMFDVSDIVYLACTSGSIGKTVDMMGVSPWEHGPKAYQAGIYMTMLSPCGNADSLTIPGTPLRVMDSMGVNSWGPGFPMDSEGVWDTDGMVCSGKKLRTDWLTEEIDCGGYKIPICDETELKTLYYTEPDVVFWTKPA
ncbi:MAG: hypothetical protein H6713_05550 [Myxococcales bacterium]|nr:hypothetical protein [Myxococcales bacterium]